MIEKISFGEDKNIEYKRQIPKNHEKFLKDIIAFSNCTGGKVILGVEDITNIVCGIGDINPFNLSDDISNMISDACAPQITPDITTQTLEGQTILVIDVAPGRFRPYYLKSMGKEASAYVRINGTSRPADLRMLQELELEGQRIHYDSIQEIGMEYMEEQALKLCESMRETALSSCKTEEERVDIQNMTIEKLEDIGLLCMIGRGYAPTHAFNLMTVNTVKQAKIQCALFKGTERDEFIDRKEFRGPIYQQIDDAYKFVLRHINRSAEINGIIRRDIYELPTRAIREAITNAVTHRSYLDDSCIQVSIFDDRVEILSPGMLYGGLDLKAALAGKSKCRNAAISEAFYYMGIIEAWGTGLGRIRKSCREYGLQEPVIEEFGDSFRVVFYRKKSPCTKIDTETMTHEQLHSTETSGSSIQGSTENKMQNSPTSTELSSHNAQTLRASAGNAKEKLIDLLIQQPSITQQQAADQLGYSKAWIRKIMENLQKENILHREGSTKKGVWIISR